MSYDWQEGENVIIVNYGSANVRAYTDVVERLTKTQVVTAKRGKFSRRDGRVVGSSPYAVLYPAASDVAQNALRRYRLDTAAAEVVAQANEFRKDANLSTAQAVRQAVDYWEFMRGPE